MSGPSASLDLYPTGVAGDAGGAGDGNSGEEDVVLQGTLSSAPPGSSSGAPGAPGFNTLDEPIKETILRDVRAVGRKFFHVLYPVERKSLLRVSREMMDELPTVKSTDDLLPARNGTCGAPSSCAPSWRRCCRATTPTWTTRTAATAAPSSPRSSSSSGWARSSSPSTPSCSGETSHSSR